MCGTCSASMAKMKRVYKFPKGEQPEPRLGYCSNPCLEAAKKPIATNLVTLAQFNSRRAQVARDAGVMKLLRRV